jgi:hypothetical protein
MVMSRFLALALVAGIGGALPAQASLIGDTVGASITGPNVTVAPGSAVVVTPGSEFTYSIPAGPIVISDVGAYSVRFTMADGLSVIWTGGAWTLGLTGLDFAGFPAGLVGVTIADSVGVTGLAAADISFTANSVTLDVTGQSWSERSYVLLAFDVGATTAVPAPASAGLLAAGLFGLIGLGHRRRPA